MGCRLRHLLVSRAFPPVAAKSVRIGFRRARLEARDTGPSWARHRGRPSGAARSRKGVPNVAGQAHDHEQAESRARAQGEARAEERAEGREEELAAAEAGSDLGPSRRPTQRLRSKTASRRRARTNERDFPFRGSGNESVPPKDGHEAAAVFKGDLGMKELGWRSSACALAVLVLAGTAAQGGAAAPIPSLLHHAGADACGKTKGLVCSEVDVPLDRTGAVAGTIPLHVEVLPSQGVQRGVMFLVAGGPGRGRHARSTSGAPTTLRSFASSSPATPSSPTTTAAPVLRLAPLLWSGGRRLRRTRPRNSSPTARQRSGRSERSTAPPTTPKTSRRCGNHSASTASRSGASPTAPSSPSPTRSHTRTTSSGSCSTLSYRQGAPIPSAPAFSRQCPPRSPPTATAAPAERQRPTSRATSSRSRTTSRCTHSRAAFARPTEGQCGGPAGRAQLPRHGRRRRSDPGLAAELPAAVQAARAGDTQPLLRLALLETLGGTEPAADLSVALYSRRSAATAPSPGSPTRRSPTEPALAQAALAALPAGSFGPFGAWASGLSNVDTCLTWPTPAGGRHTREGPLPGRPRPRPQRWPRPTHTDGRRRRGRRALPTRAAARRVRGSATACSPPTSRAARRTPCAAGCSAAPYPRSVRLHGRTCSPYRRLPRSTRST